ncbi:MAG: c-type cytochrome [Gemmatimonadota bacterium]
MSRSVLRFAIAALLTSAATAVRAQTPQPADPVPAPARGLYTGEQAARGKATFERVCSECHGRGQFQGSSFRFAWEGRTVYDLVNQIRSTMPQDDPGGLAAASYLELVAYLLQLNDYPPGATPLPPDDEELKALRIEASTDSAASGRP